MTSQERASITRQQDATSTLVIAVDGPSGSGKSTVARGVARKLELRYLDTGAMYRAMTLWMLQHGVDVRDANAVAARTGEPRLDIDVDPDEPAVRVDGQDVSESIRTREVSNTVSAVSAVQAVRRQLNALQRIIMAGGGIVVEGRDIGTVVAKDAPVKVFLVASAEVRAQRRSDDLAVDPEATVEATQAEMDRRDTYDSSRAAAPLTKADDAVEIDSTSMSADEVVDEVLKLIKDRVGVS